MRFAPTVPVGVVDNKLITLFTQIVKCLQLHPDHKCYTVTVVWTVPFILGVENVLRPNVVRLGNAQLAEAPQTIVEWGAATNWVWTGGGQIRILNQAGLLEGVRYILTWEVVG